MVLISDLEFSLPLKNPVVIFSIVLFIILFAPIIFNRLRIPHIIGLIIAGIVIGPYGFNLLLRDSSIVLFGTVGLIYIMFTAGLEIDLVEFRKNRVASMVFGLLTFILPMIFGIVAGLYVLDYALLSSLLLGGMMASHTLLAYPITSKYGISRIRAVTLTIGGTIVTDILALLVLAGVTGMTKGEISTSFWLRLLVSTIVFGIIIFTIFPLIARWFFKKFDDSVSQYIFVLAIVFLGSFLAEVAGLEAIIGAFLSGLALNRFIPHSSALMSRIDFVGNAFFIPFFLIGVGMLVDFTVLFNGWAALGVAAVMTVVAVGTKYLAALIMRKSFRLTHEEGKLVFGLSTARVGATLAVVLVGYNIIIGETQAGEPVRLLNEDVLNGTILMILVTCTISSFIVERASRKLALLEENKMPASLADEKILVALAYPDSVVELVNLGLMLKPKNTVIPVFALTVVSDDIDSPSNAIGKKMLKKAVEHALGTDDNLIPLTRHDVNISNGIIYTIREQHVTDIVIGLHQNASVADFLGLTAQHILKRVPETIYIYHPVQPFNTIKRMIVPVTPRAELEPGFSHWFKKLATVAKEASISIEFYAAENTIAELMDQKHVMANPPKMNFHRFENWDDFLIFSKEVKSNDLLTIISSRKDHVSYQPALDKLPYYLMNYFVDNSFIILFPDQLEHGIHMEKVQHFDSTLGEVISEKVSSVTRSDLLSNLFRKKKEE